MLNKTLFLSFVSHLSSLISHRSLVFLMFHTSYSFPSPRQVRNYVQNRESTKISDLRWNGARKVVIGKITGRR